ncbi:MAG: hypothetical protein H0V81_11940 [Solirubrobacterales bacterium]|nr:hypothetical protein [Solirubrobacterales bacterium]
MAHPGSTPTENGAVVAPSAAVAGPAFADWLTRWRALAPDPEAMDHVNPLYIPRNHLVEEALTQATLGNLSPFHELHAVLERPFTPQPGREAYAAPGSREPYVTFCGT